MRPREIRQLVEQTFQSLRPSPQPLTREALLIRDGHYCGHRYESRDLAAVWFLEEQQVKVFDKQGRPLRVLQLDGTPDGWQRAA